MHALKKATIITLLIIYDYNMEYMNAHIRQCRRLGAAAWSHQQSCRHHRAPAAAVSLLGCRRQPPLLQPRWRWREGTPSGGQGWFLILHQHHLRRWPLSGPHTILLLRSWCTRQQPCWWWTRRQRAGPSARQNNSVLGNNVYAYIDY